MTNSNLSRADFDRLVPDVDWSGRPMIKIGSKHGEHSVAYVRRSGQHDTIRAAWLLVDAANGNTIGFKTKAEAIATGLRSNK